MKVICVKPFNNQRIMDSCKNAPRPEVGDESTVTQTYWDEIAKANYHSLAEFPGYKYKADHFAILPNTSAHEMQEQEREAIVNLENAVA